MPQLPFIDRETEITAIDRAVQDPAQRRALYEIIEAVLRVNENQKVTPAELAPILAGFQFPDEALWRRAATWLVTVYDFDLSLSAHLDQLYDSLSALNRFNLCASVDHLPKTIAISLLRRSISDEIYRVKQVAILNSMQFGFIELVPDLKHRLQTETDAACQRYLYEAIFVLECKTYELGLDNPPAPKHDIETLNRCGHK